MEIPVGELDRRIEIFRRGELPKSGLGEPPLDLVRSCWAKVSAVTGREEAAADADLGEAEIRFLVRRGPARIGRKMVVRCRGEDYEAVFVDDWGRDYTQIFCKRISTRG